MESTRRSIKKEQKKCAVIQIVLCGLYAVLGVVLFNLEHCHVDEPLYWLGAAVVAACVLVYGVFEARLSEHISRR